MLSLLLRSGISQVRACVLLASGLARCFLVFFSQLSRTIEHAFGHDVSSFNPSLSILLIARPDTQPLFTSVRCGRSIEDVHLVAACDLYQIRCDNSSRASNLRPPRNHHPGIVLLCERATARER